MPIAIVNMGGVRGEDLFFSHLDPTQAGGQGVRVEMSTDQLLPALVSELRKDRAAAMSDSGAVTAAPRDHVFKDMLS